jgi:uncharacterized lipoprotein YehR (DUF1307 family)
MKGPAKLLACVIILAFVLQLAGCGQQEVGGKPKKVPIKVAFGAVQKRSRS